MSPLKLTFPHNEDKYAKHMANKVKNSPLAYFIKPEVIVTSTDLEKYLSEKYPKAS